VEPVKVATDALKKEPNLQKKLVPQEPEPVPSANEKEIDFKLTQLQYEQTIKTDSKESEDAKIGLTRTPMSE
jgi:hypothetical protein